MFPRSFSPTNGLYDRTDTYSQLEPDAEMSSEQPNPNATNLRSTEYKLRQNPKPNCNDKNRY